MVANSSQAGGLGSSRDNRGKEAEDEGRGATPGECQRDTGVPAPRGAECGEDEGRGATPRECQRDTGVPAPRGAECGARRQRAPSRSQLSLRLTAEAPGQLLTVC